MGKQKKLKKPRKKNKENTFKAQVICKCNRKCADVVDVLTQKDIFEKYHGMTKWSEKTKFLRSVAKREPAKENISARVNLKKKNYFTSYYLDDSNGEPQRVCSDFLIKLLDINRTKLFRAISTITTNPNAIDHRGETAKKKKSNPVDIAFVVDFIQTLPKYESKSKPKSSEIKYFHPNLTPQKLYQLYGNICKFKQRNSLSKSVFVKVLKERFVHLRQFKNSKDCHTCKKIKEQKKRKVLSLTKREKIEKEEENHIAKVKAIKDDLMQSIDTSEESTEILIFELQQPQEMPSVPIDESYDWKPLWFFNLCVFDEKSKKAHMYVWDEAVAEKGPEQIASCLFKHIYTIVPKTAKKVILYSKSTGLYQNMQISLMLKKICDYQNKKDLITIEQRFFMKGHDSNDCGRCFENIDKQKRKYHEKQEYLYASNEWTELVKWSKLTQPRFEVINMTENDFFSVEKLMKFVVSEKHSANGEEIVWPEISNITYTLSEPMQLFIRYFSDETVVYLLSNEDIDEFRRTPLLYSNKGGNTISKDKFDSLQINLKYIPTIYHDFYKSIKFKDSTKEDLSLASYSSDEESK